MIGNDIVDLRTAFKESNWRRRGFLDKIFTQKEQELILNDPNSFLMVWRLWSMKESAYKIYVQQHSERFFAPKKLVCTIINSTKGIVNINGEAYHTKSIINSNYIYTTATFKNENTAYSTCFKTGQTSAKNQRKQTYHRLKLAIAKKYQLAFEAIEIKKTAIGVPKLYQNNIPLTTTCSITHHGRYGAFSILSP